MRARPIAPASLVSELAERIARATPTDGWLRVGVDGAPIVQFTPPGSGTSVTFGLGIFPVRVDADDFLRPASVRLELGRDNPDSYYEAWFDLAALRREVLDPLRPGGSGRILTTFWNPATDRATRAPYQDVPPRGVLLLAGALLLGSGLELDLTVHCAQSPAALARRLPPELAWTRPAYLRYAEEVAPETFADVVLRMDDPAHPALVEAAG